MKLEHQTDASRKSLGRNYSRAATFYETLARLYSLNQITNSKRAQLEFVQPGDRTIFLGVGSGEDALMAARHGADVTCVDISQGMLDAVQRRLNRQGLNANLICQSATELEATGQFDNCCANYFLNMFRHEDMLKMFAHAVKLVRPGGRFMIADVALPQGNLFYRAFNLGYRKLAMFSFWLLGLVPLHRDHDYESHFKKLGLELEAVRYHRLFPGGPVVYQTIVGVRKEGMTE